VWIAAGGEHGNVLLAVLALVSDRHRFRGFHHLRYPQLLARLGAECPEACILSSRNED